MEENKDYKVYRFDYLTEGSQLKFEHSVYCEDVDISSLITQGADALEALRQDSMDGEQKAFEIVQAAAKQWEQQAAVTQPCAGISADPGGCAYHKPVAAQSK